MRVPGRNELSLLRGVVLAPSADGPPLELRLEPAARVRLSLPETERTPTGVEIRQAGETIWFALLTEGTTVCVPPGPLELELQRWTPSGRESLQTRTAVARLGEETVVEFDALPR